MAPVETAYYELLNIAPDAKAGELTSAYRKMCLRLHPDKGGSEEQFKAMKAAYDVLKDPQKRKMYDSHGEAIVRAMDGEVLEPEVMLKVVMHFTKSASRMVLCALPLIAVVLLLPAVALSLRWDRRIALNWMLVFAPMWIVHLIVLVLLLKLRSVMSAAADTEACEDETERADAEERKLKVKRLFSITSCMVILIMAQEAVMAAKLQGDTQASWFFVLIPYLTFELCMLYMRIRLLAIVEPMGPSLPFVAKTIMFSSMFWWCLLRLSTVALIASKADGLIVCSWTVCLIPMMVGASCQLLWSCRSKSIRRAVDDEEPGQETPRAPGFVAACLAIAIWLSMLLLGAGKLDGGEYSAFLVFLPFFLVVAQLLCCCTCLACCGPVVLDAFLKEEQAKAGEQPNDEAQTLTPGLTSGSTDYSTLA